MIWEKFLPNDPREFAKFFRDRAEGHAPGYDLAVYGRPHQLMALAKMLEDASVAATPPKEALEAAIRCAKLALFVIRKQDAMPNSSWESGFNVDLKKAEDGLAAMVSRPQRGEGT